MQQLKGIILWKGRTDPANRIIPPNLKLAILSRGKIMVPADRIEFFLDVVRDQGGTWPDRMDAKLADIQPEYLVTFELFQNQRLTMTPDEIRESIQGYLVLRQKQQLASMCWMVLFTTTPGNDRLTIQTAMDVDVGELYRKPQVVIRPKDDPYRYVLVCYVCLPPSVQAHVFAKDTFAPPAPPLPSAMPALDGVLKSNAEVHIRKDATITADSLGVLAGTAGRVKVTDKKEAGNELWYNIELLDPVRVVKKVGDPIAGATYLPAGTKGWMVARGLNSLAASWALLRHDLAAYDTDNSAMSLGDRITALRQSTHGSKLPFDAIIGTKKGKMYLDQTPFDATKWQLGRDYQAFIPPDGRTVDLHHLLVGMDVLSRREQSADWLGNPIGTNWSATTWAGDVGSCAAEATLARDSTTWERWNPAATENDKIQYYFTTRASEHDLLGDLDGWGIQRLRAGDPAIDSIDRLFAIYYGTVVKGGTRSLTEQRKDSIELFLSHYDLTYDPATDPPNYPTLPKQKKPAMHMVNQVDAFGRIWMLRQNPHLVFEQDPNARAPRYVGEMTVQYLWWLEYQAIENGAEVQ